MSEPKNVSVVVIGLNIAPLLPACFSAILEQNYPKEKLEILYVDSGSTDNTEQVVAQYPQVCFLSADDGKPSPGKGRNVGWKRAKHDLILFLDGDTQLDPDWLRTAVSAVEKNVVAVTGGLEEVNAKKNFYHLIASIEWNAPVGPTTTFGGNVLLRASALEKAGGYDCSLEAGEDPELSYRLRKHGYQILRTKGVLGYHDIDMNSFVQYWKRSVRTGHAFAEVFWMHKADPEKFWMKETVRICLSALVPLLLVLGLAIGNFSALAYCLAPPLIFRPLRNLKKYQARYHLTAKEAFLYSLHLSFVPFPQFIGIIKFITKN